MGLNAALHLPLSGERRRDDGNSLVGSRCGACRAASFPARAVCHDCGTAAPAEEAFSPTGTLITYTTVHVERPGMPVPYTLGQIAIDGAGPLVFGQVKADGDVLSAGLAVRVVVGAAGDLPKYWFVPA
jgi:uncharacterized OB-fold protein